MNQESSSKPCGHDCSITCNTGAQQNTSPLLILFHLTLLGSTLQFSKYLSSYFEKPSDVCGRLLSSFHKLWDSGFKRVSDHARPRRKLNGKKRWGSSTSAPRSGVLPITPHHNEQVRDKDKTCACTNEARNSLARLSKSGLSSMSQIPENATLNIHIQQLLTSDFLSTWEIWFSVYFFWIHPSLNSVNSNWILEEVLRLLIKHMPKFFMRANKKLPWKTNWISLQVCSSRWKSVGLNSYKRPPTWCLMCNTTLY